LVHGIHIRTVIDGNHVWGHHHGLPTSAEQNLEIRLKDSTRLFSPLALALGVVFGCAVVAAPLAQAAADPKRDAELETRFKAADKNNDGCLTRQEAEAGMPRVAKGFDKIDAAKKGCITLDQIKAFADK
jgi:hypothetical protein